MDLALYAKIYSSSCSLVHRLSCTKRKLKNNEKEIKTKTTESQQGDGKSAKTVWRLSKVYNEQVAQLSQTYRATRQT